MEIRVHHCLLQMDRCHENGVVSGTQCVECNGQVVVVVQLCGQSCCELLSELDWRMKVVRHYVHCVMSLSVSGTSCCGLCWCSRLTGVGERLRLGVVDLRRCCVRWMMRTSDGSGP